MERSTDERESVPDFRKNNYQKTRIFFFEIGEKKIFEILRQ